MTYILFDNCSKINLISVGFFGLFKDKLTQPSLLFRFQITCLSKIILSTCYPHLLIKTGVNYAVLWLKGKSETALVLLQVRVKLSESPCDKCVIWIQTSQRLQKFWNFWERTNSEAASRALLPFYRLRLGNSSTANTFNYNVNYYQGFVFK